MEKVSIIVPVYNGEKYLKGCLDSLCKQTYGNIEIIVIDDGSTDSTNEICKLFSKTDNRVIVESQSNKGVSSARNKGLALATGDWVTFVDSDDYVSETFIECLLKYRSYEHIIGGNVVFGEIEKNRHIKQFSCIKVREKESDIIDFYGGLNTQDYLCYPWGKLFKREIIISHNLKFNTKLILGEDLCFNLEYISYCNNIAFVPFSNYFYRYENQKNKFLLTLEMMETHFNVFNAILDELENNSKLHFPNLRQSINLAFFWKHFSYVKSIKNYAEYKIAVNKFQKNGKKFLTLLSNKSIFKQWYVKCILLSSFGYYILKLKK